MDWTTIPIELIEQILILTVAPCSIVNACMTCKTWNGVGADSHLWKVKSIKIINNNFESWSIHLISYYTRAPNFYNYS